jgi:mRNA-degrading endonuclease RelE of RelBE toxin-antitoxin system
MTVIWEPSAVGDLERLDPPIARQIRNQVERFAGTGHGDLAALHGPLAGFLRLRVRAWRVFLQRGPGQTLHVLAVHKRGDAYR